MRILQINVVYGVKSTGRTCLETSKALTNAGHECFTAYGYGHSNDDYTYKIDNKVEYFFHNIMSRITGYQGYYSKNATIRLLEYIDKISPDIIHLRNLHANYLNLPLLFEYLINNRIPVVLNLHDCWAFTGKCAYYSDINCDKWKTECNDCPVLRQYPQSLIFDRTNKLFNDKKKWFSLIENLTVIGVSDWVADQAQMSFLGNRDIYTVYNWVNRNVFKTYPDNVFPKYNVDDSKFIILGVSASWTKGTSRYEDFVKLSSMISEDMEIVLIGEKTDNEKLPSNIKHIDYLDNTIELAKFYSSADVYVHLGTEDTFGKVIAEAMACGTPVIANNSTVYPEIVGSGCGYIVEKRCVQDIYDKICIIRDKGKENYSSNCISWVKEKFDYYTNTSQLLSIYNQILDKYSIE